MKISSTGKHVYVRATDLYFVHIEIVKYLLYAKIYIFVLETISA
jgi:hypothetical protein